MSSPQNLPPKVSQKNGPTVNLCRLPYFPTLVSAYIPSPLCKDSSLATVTTAKHAPSTSPLSSNTNLSYPITTLADCKSSKLVYQLLHWHYSPVRAFASIMDHLQTSGPRPYFWFPNRQFFMGWGFQPPTWRTMSHIYNCWDWVAQLYPQAPFTTCMGYSGTIL